MRPNPSTPKSPAKKPAEAVVKDIRRATRRHFSAEDKIRIVLEGLTCCGVQARSYRPCRGALTTDQVQDLLGYKSVQAVHKAVSSGRLLAVDDNGRKLFPAFQFDGGSVASGMASVLAATPTTNPWALLQFMVAGDEGLGDEQPMVMVKGGLKAIERLARFAATLED